MSIDPNATPKDYRLIIYNKTEINAIELAEATRVNTQLALKSLKSTEGSPNGIATLDIDGTLDVSQLPVASLADSNNELINNQAITPASLRYRLNADVPSLTVFNNLVSEVTVNTTYISERAYEYNNVKSVTIPDENYIEVNRLTTTNLSAGTYQISLSMIHSFNASNRKAYFRFSFDAGGTWTEMVQESKDVNDKLVNSYITIDEFAGGIKTIIIEAKKETAANTLIVLDQTIIYQRKN